MTKRTDEYILHLEEAHYDLVTALEMTINALYNVPCVGDIYDQQHSDTHQAATIAAKAALTKAALANI